MKKLQILGTGCPKCKKLTELTEAAAKAAGIEYELEKVTDINDIVAFGVMTTPALVVDGEVKVAGRLPSASELQSMLT
jgi:small redox-active disulfide protein 2